MAQYQLIMRTGPTPGAVFALEGDQLTIGRDSTNEVTINDAEVPILPRTPECACLIPRCDSGVADACRTV